MPPSLRISVLLLLAALACNLPTTPPTATIEATPQPTQPAAVVLPTATAQPPLPPGSIWVGVEGLSRRVAIVTPEGNVTLQELPLPPGQQASTLTPTPAGLAFIMWDANGAQRGAGLWASTGLVELARTEPGFRMIDLLAGEEALAVLQVAADTPLAEADWLVGTVPLAGGRFAPVADRASVGDIPPPDLFAWPGPLLLNAAAPDGTSQGIFALDTASGASRAILTADAIIAAPRLSPDGVHIAYLTLDPPTADVPTNVLRVHNLRTDETVTLSPAADEAIFGARWIDEGRLLLDIVQTQQQLWAVAPLEGEWSRSAPADRDLLDYLPFGEGVVYTTLPVDGDWALSLLPDLSAEPQIVDLGELAQPLGAPRVLYAP